MKPWLIAAAAGALSWFGVAVAQNQFATPAGPDLPAILAVNGCLDATRKAIPCSDAGAVGTAVTANQGGTWRIASNTGTPTASAVTALGLTSTTIFGLKTNPPPNWRMIQNQSTTGNIWCNPAGAAAVAGAPSVQIAPGMSWSPGGGSGYVPSSVLTCIAAVDATPIAAWQSP